MDVDLPFGVRATFDGVAVGVGSDGPDPLRPVHAKNAVKGHRSAASFSQGAYR
jgi:hypothetical protein